MKKRIIIADDSNLILAQLGDTLSEMGYEVAGTASSGTEAVEKARVFRPDLILMDIVMPGDLDGIEAARQIDERYEIPIVFLTAHEDDDLIERAKEVGADGYIVKPFKHGELKATIEIVLKKKQLEKKFKNLYRELVENTNDLIYVTDGKGNIEYVNNTASKNLGYARDDFIGKNFSDFIAPDSYRHAAEIFKRQMRGEDVGAFELTLFDRDDKPRIIETRERLVWKDGRVVEVHGIGRDITERKRSEEVLRQSEEKYRDLVENIEDIVYIVDDKGSIRYINRAMEKFSGYKKEELLNTNYMERLTPESLERIKAVFERRLAGEDVVIYEFEFRGKDGRVHTIETREKLVWKDGRVIEAHGIGRDVTERNKMIEALRESEEKFRNLFETSRDFICISTIDGKIIDVNESAKRFFGYTDDERATFNTIMLYADPAERERFVEEAIKRGFVEDYEIRTKKKDGTLVDVLVTVVVKKNEQGNPVMLQANVKDITERKKFEHHLLQTEKLSSMGTMISGIAHELNSPLTSIIGNAQLLMNKNTPDDIRTKLEVILAESRRSSKIVNGLLAFAREHKPERRIVDINEIIRETVKLREYELKVSNIDIILSLSEDVPITFADPYQLQQVFINIINNAHDALMEPEGGTLSIISMRKKGSIIVEFEDNGPGMTKETLQKIFDPFFTTKEAGKGTGIGLSMAYGIIREHGGEITVDSKPGSGAKFTVELPIVKKTKVKEEKSEVVIQSPPIGKTVLVIEDEQSLKDIIVEALTEDGYVVEGASGGEEALRLIKKKKFDAIITDLKMPGISGKEIYIYVQKRHPELADKILFMTGDVLNRNIQSFIRITGNQFIEKPFELDRLITTLNVMFAEG